MTHVKLLNLLNSLSLTLQSISKLEKHFTR